MRTAEMSQLSPELLASVLAPDEIRAVADLL